MTNLFNEIIVFIIGWMVLRYYLKKNHIVNRNFSLIYYSSYIISVIIILFSARGSMHFGDGYGYYEQALSVIENQGVSIGTFLDFGIFFNAAQSWHFLPVWEFALFLVIFESTKCISIFHVILMHISFIIWYKNFSLVGLAKSGKVAVIFMTLSLYLKNFTIPALKDPMVFFLSTVIIYNLIQFYYNLKLKQLVHTIIPILVLIFTRMYIAAGLMVSLVLLVFYYIKIMYKKKNTFNALVLSCAIIIVMLIAMVAMLTTDVYAYALRWINEVDFGLVGIIFTIIGRFINFCFGPLFINIFTAQSLYYPCYVEAFIRTVGCLFLFKGIYLSKKMKNKGLLFVTIVLPMLISMVALEAGEQASAIRQYMPFYPLLSILYAIGITGLNVNYIQKNTKE